MIAATAVVAGCGSDPEPEEVAQAANAALTPQQVVDQYRAAVIGGDGATACGLLADEAKADVEEGASDCATRLGAFADQDTPEDTAAFKAMHPKAAVNGTKAVAKFETLGGDPTKIVLEKQPAGWRVTDSPELENVRISNGEY
jgi:hypothetical protein